MTDNQFIIYLLICIMFITGLDMIEYYRKGKMGLVAILALCQVSWVVTIITRII